MIDRREKFANEIKENSNEGPSHNSNDARNWLNDLSQKHVDTVKVKTIVRKCPKVNVARKSNTQMRKRKKSEDMNDSSELDESKIISRIEHNLLQKFDSMAETVLSKFEKTINDKIDSKLNMSKLEEKISEIFDNGMIKYMQSIEKRSRFGLGKKKECL